MYIMIVQRDWKNHIPVSVSYTFSHNPLFTENNRDEHLHTRQQIEIGINVLRWRSVGRSRTLFFFCKSFFFSTFSSLERLVLTLGNE